MYHGRMEMISQRFLHGMHMRSVEAERPEGVLFYIHGLGDSGLCFERIMTHPALKGYFHLAPDLPGYGKSPWPETPLSIPEQADLLCNRISGFDLPRAVVIGHSMGGVIGTYFCERCPRQVRAFINVEGNISLDDCTFSCEFAAFELDHFIAEGFDAYRNVIYQKGMTEKALRSYHAGLLMCDPRAVHADSRKLVELSEREDLSSRLGKLDVPSFYAWGNPRGTGEYSLNLLKKANVPLIEISDAGHWPFIDRRDMFAQKILEVIKSLPG